MVPGPGALARRRGRFTRVGEVGHEGPPDQWEALGLLCEQAQQSDPGHEHSPADHPDRQLATVGRLIGAGSGDAEQLGRLGHGPGQAAVRVEGTPHSVAFRQRRGNLTTVDGP